MCTAKVSTSIGVCPVSLEQQASPNGYRLVCPCAPGDHNLAKLGRLKGEESLLRRGLCLVDEFLCVDWLRWFLST